jgi:CRISPR-associated protein Csy3
MAKKAASVETFPSVLAFEKRLVPSDGRMFGVQFAERKTATGIRLRLYEKAVRGTISNRLSDKLGNDAAKIDAEVEKANLQTVDNCSLPADCDTLKLQFTLKVLANVQEPCACNVASFQESCREAVTGYIQRTNFQTLAQRYATNIANGRFLWRNRVGAEALEVEVRIPKDSKHAEQTLIFDSEQFNLRDFEKSTSDLEKLTEIIASALSGKTKSVHLSIDAYAKMGAGQEVYPSEELVSEKGDKSKVLYSVDGVAAMHSQKLGNALRTIDTWYADDRARPIAIEAYGSVTNLGVAYRKPTTKNDFYTLFDRFALGGKLDPNEEHYVIAMLVRGGVFGKSAKKE